jgi:alpha-L-fucosidase
MVTRRAGTVLLLLPTAALTAGAWPAASPEADTRLHSPMSSPPSPSEVWAVEGQTLLAAARESRREIEAVLAAGPYRPTWDSLGRHPVPEWYVDAKLGVFYDWGLYSVAGHDEKEWKKARYPDWYLHHMYTSLKDYHARTWGVDFERDDFIPLFTAEAFDAEEVVDLVVESGARYLVPFSKHHDGFCLWDSSFTHRDVVDMGPGFDVAGALVRACRKHSIRHGFYFSVEEYEYPVARPDGTLALRLWNERMADGAKANRVLDEVLAPLEPRFERRISGKVPVPDFVADYLIPQAREYIDRYEPDILWFDGEWERPSDYYRMREIGAYFYDRAEGRREVVMNDRLGRETRRAYGDFYTSETDEITEPIDRIWEECRSMSGSYGYERGERTEDYLSATELVHMLVRIVARGGNLLLIANPDGDGRLPEVQVERLRQLGRWLGVNGEAIYATRRYETHVEATQLGERTWYTRSKDSRYAYAILLDFPRDETVVLSKANPKHGTAVHMLGYDEPLEWVDTGKDAYGMVVRIPEEMRRDSSRRPCDHAWVIRFEWDEADAF